MHADDDITKPLSVDTVYNVTDVSRLLRKLRQTLNKMAA